MPVTSGYDGAACRHHCPQRAASGATTPFRRARAARRDVLGPLSKGGDGRRGPRKGLHGHPLLRRRAPCLPCRPTDPGVCAVGARSLRGPSSLLSLSVRHTSSSSSSSARSLARSRVPRASLVSWSGGVDLASAASAAASRATVVVVVLRYTQLSSSSPSVELSRFEGGKNKVVGGASGSE